MLKLIQGMIVVAAAIFIVAAVALIWLNPSPKIKQQTFSIVAAAAITVFLSTFLALKESTRDAEFICTMFWDRTTETPAPIRPRGRLRRGILSIEMARIASLAKERGIEPPHAAFHANPNLLQYMIVRELCQRFRDRWSVQLVSVVGSGGTIQIQYARPTRDSEPHRQLTPEDIARLLSENPYGGVKEQLMLAVPPKTSVQVFPSSSKKGKDTSVSTIVIAKPLCFEVRIKLTPCGGSEDSANVDALTFGLDVADLEKLKTYPVLVELHASFNRATSENPESEFYKAWVDELFATLKGAFADP
jgi:hypothetical protein